MTRVGIWSGELSTKEVDWPPYSSSSSTFYFPISPATFSPRELELSLLLEVAAPFNKLSSVRFLGSGSPLECSADEVYNEKDLQMFASQT